MRDLINKSLKNQIEIKEKERIKLERKQNKGITNNIGKVVKTEMMDIDKTTSKLSLTPSPLYNERNHQIPHAYNSQSIKTTYFNDVELEEYSVMYFLI